MPPLNYLYPLKNPKTTSMRAVYELLSSMRFAVSLLTVLGIASVIGTVLKQNQVSADYIVEFGQFWFGFFDLLGLYDVYHSAWFLLILLFLVLSTTLCIYRNAPGMLKELRSWREHATENSLRAFSHQASYSLPPLSGQDAISRLGRFLQGQGFRFKTIQQANGDVLLAAKAGHYQRLGYILTHAAIVIICIGGLIDGNVPFKVQELLGWKVVETRDIPENAVPAESRLSISNLSFRANMTLPEGTRSNVAFMRMRDGYLVQELPFSVALEQFRIEHYATGQPKSFESDLVIIDKDLKAPLKATIRVNHPLIYKGIAIYQSDFQDGGSKLQFNAWPLFSAKADPKAIDGRVGDHVKTGEGDQALTLELDDFRLFNVLNLSEDEHAKPHNVGPSVTFKVRDSQGQAREYLNYMQPLTIDGRPWFVSGMRTMQSENFRYLRIPADSDNSLGDFMRLRAVLFDAAAGSEIAKRLASKFLSAETSADVREKFQSSVEQLLKAFAQGGYNRVAEVIEKSVPVAEREKAADAYLKIIGNASYEAFQISRERAGMPAATADDKTLRFIHESLNAMSDLFFYGTPFFLQLTQFEQRQASGLQLTRSPGKNLVYAGSLLLVMGIFTMIYLRERRIWFLVKNETREVLFAMSANRKNRDLDLEFTRYREQLNSLMQGA
jgi:cytochrome c biogenesis protein